MKNNYIKTGLLLLTIFFTSCNDFLDVNPDRRTQLDSQEKIRKILVSAYPQVSYATLTELSSDNIDDLGDKVAWDKDGYSMFYWEEVNNNLWDTPEYIWSGMYEAISNSNAALDAIKNIGDSQDLKAEKAEALITRAYAHFILVNIFAKHYNEQTSSNDLGIVYMEKSERELNPKYKRESVADVYKKIERDLLEALPFINDEIYQQPKYHFNKAAANAFAARFYLYMHQWEKAEKYASIVIGDNPTLVLRDWKGLNNSGYEASEKRIEFGSSKSNANLLITEPSTNKFSRLVISERHQRFRHHTLLAESETIRVPSFYGAGGTNFYMEIFEYVNPYNSVGFYNVPPTFHIRDEVAQTGSPHTIEILFSTDETLLIRAEARAMQKKYNPAIEDLKVWASNFCKNTSPITEDSINNFFNNMKYSTKDKPTQKKELNPTFTIEEGTQKNLIHAVLQCRRVLTLNDGLRWFDIKRYGIEIYRRVLENQGTEIKEHKDFLGKDDPRRAIQLPKSVIRAGLEANPR